MRFRFRAAARRDLEQIWLDTADQRGADQAEKYVTEIEATVTRLSDFPERGTKIRTNVGTFRKMASGRHLVFYLVGQDEIDVVRILHQRMDLTGVFAAGKDSA